MWNPVKRLVPCKCRGGEVCCGEAAGDGLRAARKAAVLGEAVAAGGCCNGWAAPTDERKW